MAELDKDAVETVNVDPIPPAPHPAEIDELRRALEQSTAIMRLVVGYKQTGTVITLDFAQMRQQIAENERLLNAQ